MHPFAYAEMPPIDIGDRTSFEDYPLYPSSDPHMSTAFHQDSSQFQLHLSQLQYPHKGHYTSAYTAWIDESVFPHAGSPHLITNTGVHLSVPNANHVASPWNHDLSSISGAESPRSSCDGSFAPSSLMETYPSPPSIYDDPSIALSNAGRYSSPVGSATGSIALPQIQTYPDPEPIVEPIYPLSPPQPLVYDMDTQDIEVSDQGEDMSLDALAEIIPSHASLFQPQSGRRKTRRNPRKTPQPTRIAKQVTIEKPQRKTPSTPAQKSGRKKMIKKEPSTPRVFVCSFSHYGCPSTFASKNEWKRHIASQHLQLGYFRCDVGDCDDSRKHNRKKYGHATASSRTHSASHDHSARQTNDFNRKDLFTQHQRRMHAPWVLENRTTSSQERLAFENSLDGVRSRCWREQRKPPQQSQCGFCAQEFSGPESWSQRTEHVGRHFEKDDCPVPEKEDVHLRNWALNEGLIQCNDKGKWVLVALRG